LTSFRACQKSDFWWLSKIWIFGLGLVLRGLGFGAVDVAFGWLTWRAPERWQWDEMTYGNEEPETRPDRPDKTGFSSKTCVKHGKNANFRKTDWEMTE